MSYALVDIDNILPMLSSYLTSLRGLAATMREPQDFDSSWRANPGVYPDVIRRNFPMSRSEVRIANIGNSNFLQLMSANSPWCR